MTSERECFATERQRCQKETTVQKKVPWFPDQQEVLQDPPHQSADHLLLASWSTGLRNVLGDRASVSSVTLVDIETCTRPFREAIDTSLSLHRRS